MLHSIFCMLYIRHACSIFHDLARRSKDRAWEASGWAFLSYVWMRRQTRLPEVDRRLCWETRLERNLHSSRWRQILQSDRGLPSLRHVQGPWRQNLGCRAHKSRESSQGHYIWICFCLTFLKADNSRAFVAVFTKSWHVWISIIGGIDTSSTAQGGGGSFKNRKPIGEIGCCESGMAERIHWWTERCLRSPLFLSLSLTIYLPTYLSSMYLSIYRSIDLSISLFLSFISLPIYLCTYLPIYLSISLSFICLSV